MLSKDSTPVPKHKTELTDQQQRERNVRMGAIPVGLVIVGMLAVASHIEISPQNDDKPAPVIQHVAGP